MGWHVWLDFQQFKSNEFFLFSPLFFLLGLGIYAESSKIQLYPPAWIYFKLIIILLISIYFDFNAFLKFNAFLISSLNILFHLILVSNLVLIFFYYFFYPLLDFPPNLVLHHFTSFNFLSNFGPFFLMMFFMLFFISFLFHLIGNYFLSLNFYTRFDPCCFCFYFFMIGNFAFFF
jgi:hypothetical protein